VEDDLFSRDEVIAGGLWRVRRARALLYLIEQEASRIVQKRTNNMAISMAPIESAGMVAALLESDSETMRRALPGESDDAYIESFRNARRTASPARSRGLADTASAWKVLLPDSPALRAEILHQMSLRHVLPANKAKSIMKVFGVGTPEFDEAYRSQVGSEVATAFAPDAGWVSSLRRRLRGPREQ
jgi:hypothetical protein